MTEHDAEDRIPCGDPGNCAAGGNCIDYADEVHPPVERPTTKPDAEVERLTREVFRLTEGPIVDYDKADPEHVEYLGIIVRHVLADRRTSNPGGSGLKVLSRAPSQVDPADDSAEVVALSRVIAASLVHHPDDTRAAARAVLADLRRQAAHQGDPDNDSAEVERVKAVIASTRHDIDLSHDGTPGEEEDFIAHAVLADLRERYVLVPREGAEEREDWGVRSPDAGYIGYAVHQDHAARLVATIRPGWTVVHRIDVRGPWQVAE